MKKIKNIFSYAFALTLASCAAQPVYAQQSPVQHVHVLKPGRHAQHYHLKRMKPLDTSSLKVHHKNVVKPVVKK